MTDEQFWEMEDKIEQGRFPANIILDEEAAELLDEQSGISKSVKGNPRKTTNFNQNAKIGGGECNCEYNDQGGASRYFKIIDSKDPDPDNNSKDINLYLGDNISNLKLLEPNSIDSVVTDPPYGLKFMGKKWDYQVPSVEFWTEVYRVLKPGGHICSFGGTRTYHRMVVNCEDAGFEVRDCISWLYGSGFPKSHNIGKAIDKKLGNEREVTEVRIPGRPGLSSGSKLTMNGKGSWQDGSLEPVEITKGTSDWEGWGSALKPAQELILLARKPLSEPTIADNVLRWGTGGINIDGSRIEGESWGTRPDTGKPKYGGSSYNESITNNNGGEYNDQGRFPANIILDEEASELLDEQSRFLYIAKVSKKERNLGIETYENNNITEHGIDNRMAMNADWKELKGNHHPTVKPVKLMMYLIKLITPPNGIVLDPFMGSGSTGIAAAIANFNFIGMELDTDYMRISEERISAYKEYEKIIK